MKWKQKSWKVSRCQYQISPSWYLQILITLGLCFNKVQYTEDEAQVSLLIENILENTK